MLLPKRPEGPLRSNRRIDRLSQCELEKAVFIITKTVEEIGKLRPSPPEKALKALQGSDERLGQLSAERHYP